MKTSKHTSNYISESRNVNTCSQCKYNRKNNTCNEVFGLIASNGSCELFEDAVVTNAVSGGGIASLNSADPTNPPVKPLNKRPLKRKVPT